MRADDESRLPVVKLDAGVTQTMPGCRVPQPEARAEYEDFFRSRYTELVTVARYAGASPTEAEEAAQQAMIEVYQNWSTIGKRWPWARRAVVNNLIKAKKRDAERVPRSVRGGHVTPASYDDLDLTVWEDTQWVCQLLGRLPPAQREVMTFIVEGWRPAEIALILGKTAATVRQNLKLARERLEQELRRDYEAELETLASRPSAREEVK